MFNPFTYKPVSQHEDEDDVFYQRKNIPLSHLQKDNFDDEVEALELPRKKSITRRQSPLSLCFVIAFCIIFVVLLITLMFYIASPSQYFKAQESNSTTVSVPTTTDLPMAQNNTIHWHRMSNGSSECTPFVIDVNSDGDDIIYTHAQYTHHIDLYHCTSNTKYENACMEDIGSPVCGAVVVAVSGQNGEVIWLRNLTRPVFGIRCVMDVNDDDETDCFVIGRYHQWDTIDKATGYTIWEADKSIGYPGYNFYYPLPLEDFDGDGVVDILNIHGGDQSYGPDETNRSPSLIVILSGKTGKKLIDPIVVPDGHESYMSPVRYTLGDNDVVLFGTGGETITGSLWAITVDSIKQYVESLHFISNNNDTEYIGCRSEFIKAD